VRPGDGSEQRVITGLCLLVQHEHDVEHGDFMAIGPHCSAVTPRRHLHTNIAQVARDERHEHEHEQ
jgi:hypothetical protein